MSLTYKRIPSGEVPPDLVKAANEAALHAAWDLGLGNMRVQWFKPYPGERHIGWYDGRWPNMIHLNSDWAKELGTEQVAAAVFHECRHAWQEKPERHMRFIGYGKTGLRETDANAYSYKKTRVHLDGAYWFDVKKYY